MAVRVHVSCSALWLALVCLPCACQRKPAAAPPPAPTSAPPAPAAPAAAPKCEALTENCTATESTALEIGIAGTTIQPPVGWKFAKQSDRSLALGPAGKSLISAVEIPTVSEQAVLDSIEKLILAAAIDQVKLDVLKRRFKKPQTTIDANGASVDLWEISKATANGVNPSLRDAGAGTLLVFVAHLAKGRVVTGIAFVVVPDAEPDAEPVMRALQTLKGKP